MPGIRQFGTVTLKKGIFAHDNRFWAWCDSIRMNTVGRTPMTIAPPGAIEVLLSR